MSRALYKRLTDDLLTKITTGDIKVGERFPPEADYASQLGVSRSTLRLAFNQLEVSGILKRRQRGGTEVISNKPMKRYDMISGNIYDVLSIGPNACLDVSDIQSVKAEDVEILANYQGISSHWLNCAGSRHIVDQQMPYTCTHVYVPERYSGFQIQVGDHFQSVFNEIEKHYDVSVGIVKQSVSAISCPELPAKIMGLEEGVPVLTTFTEMEDTEGNILELVSNYFDPLRVNINSNVRISR